MPSDDMYKYILPDIPEEEAKKLCAQLESHSSSCWHEVITYPGYKYIPTTCVIPELDYIIATEKQKAQVAREESEGVKITVHELKGVGHCPLISAPDQVAEILIGVAQAN
jgi:pimeloyl-ACP methyl ester carboxylesterase